MEIKFLGTAAAEGLPAVFCNCEYCKKGRELKDKNIRTRHQTLINEDFLIDLPADTYYHALAGDLGLDKVKYLLVTHSHNGHFSHNGNSLHSHVESVATTFGLKVAFDGEEVEIKWKSYKNDALSFASFSFLT